MILQQLLTQLNDTDPQKRIEALRILAMVEETRAINAVLQVYQHDPNPAVHDVAKWTGSRLWRAKERGYNTEEALRQHFHLSRAEDVEAALLAGIASAGVDKAEMAEVQYNDLQVQIAEADALYQRRTVPPTSKSDTQVMASMTQTRDADDLDLLDAGLMDFF